MNGFATSTVKRGKLAVTVLGDRVIGPRKNGVTSTRKPLPKFTLMEFKSTVTAESLAIVPRDDLWNLQRGQRW